jgi:hypothetical protein
VGQEEVRVCVDFIGLSFKHIVQLYGEPGELKPSILDVVLKLADLPHILKPHNQPLTPPPQL